MSNWVLRASDGTHRSVTEDESADLSVTLYDTGGGVVSASNISSIAMSLMLLDGTVINERSAVDVLNANGGTMSLGLFLMKLDPEDNPIVSTSLVAGEYETHVCQLVFEYLDNTSKLRTGIETFEFKVEKRLVPSA